MSFRALCIISIVFFVLLMVMLPAPLAWLWGFERGYLPPVSEWPDRSLFYHGLIFAGALYDPWWILTFVFLMLISFKTASKFFRKVKDGKWIDLVILNVILINLAVVPLLLYFEKIIPYVGP